MASLVGRVLRAITVFVALSAVLAVTPAQAAPFAAIVMDARSGEVLYEKNSDARLHPASLTKMMTLYITFQEIEAGRLSLDTVVTVSKHAAAQPPSRLGLKPGQKIKLRYLIRAAAVKSANDAATAIGELVGGGSEAAFAKRMTKTARALGMKNTTFKNANGLTTEGHLSSARDMTILGRHLFYDFPQYYNIFSRRSADAGMATVHNTNSRFLDGYEGADGIKTGYTVAAGFNLTASAKRGDKRIIATVFGGASTAARNAKMAELMDLGFGKAKNRVAEKKPSAAPVPDSDLIAEAPAAIDEPGVAGGAAKTIRVTGEMSRSLRPRGRPGVPAPALAAMEDDNIDDDIALAIAASVQDALAVTPAPPPEGTLEAQVVALAEAASPVEAAPAGIAVVEVPAAAAPPGTFEAQAAALAAGADPAAPPEMVAPEMPAVAMADVPTIRPMPRPSRPEAAQPAETVQEPVPAIAEAMPAEETVAPAEEILLAEAVEPDAPAQAPTLAALENGPLETGPTEDIEPAGEPALTAIETVAAPANAPIYDAAPARKAPIFESVAMAEAEPAPETEEMVVVSKSTSGGRHWGVNVGAYSSHYEAERALLKTGLAESATLDVGLRKITQSKGKYRASFLGLEQEQAELACRRIRARGMACETTGPS